MLFVEEILALARAVVPTRDHNFGKFRAEHMRRIVQNERNLGKADRTALGCAAEDHVLHLRAAELAAVLLAHDPADGVGDIGLAGAVGAYDGGDILSEIQNGLIGK